MGPPGFLYLVIESFVLENLISCSLTRYPELALNYWAKKFKIPYSIWLRNPLFVIVFSPEVAKDLIITNGNLLSSRKEVLIKSQTLSAGRGITATYVAPNLLP